MIAVLTGIGAKFRLPGEITSYDMIKNGIPLPKVIEDIKTEIRKPLNEERFFDTDTAKAQAIALNWCLEIIKDQGYVAVLNFLDIINKHIGGSAE